MKRSQAYKDGLASEKRLIRYEKELAKKEMHRTPFTPLILPEAFYGAGAAEYDIFDPKTFDEYVGQEHAKELAQIMLWAAEKEARPIPNILIAGASGLGKTTLAKLILDGKIYKFTDGNSVNTIDLAQLGGYIVIDEIHNVKSEVCDSLNTIIDKGMIRIIGCTTNPGNLPGPFRSRFRTIPLIPYTVEDLTDIQMNAIKRKGTIKAPSDLIELISKRGRFTPRRALQYLAFVMDLMVIRDESTLNEITLVDAFDKIGVDENGLLDIDHRYLAAVPTDRPVGLQYIAAVLQTDKETIEREIEPYLLQTKLIDRNSRGRYKLTSLESQLSASLDQIFKGEKPSE